MSKIFYKLNDKKDKKEDLQTQSADENIVTADFAMPSEEDKKDSGKGKAQEFNKEKIIK